MLFGKSKINSTNLLSADAMNILISKKTSTTLLSSSVKTKSTSIASISQLLPKQNPIYSMLFASILTNNVRNVTMPKEKKKLLTKTHNCSVWSVIRVQLKPT